MPDNITDVQGRMKDIQYSSRTRLVTDMLQRSQRFRHVLREVLDRVPAEHARAIRGASSPMNCACSKRYNVIHLIYRHKEYEGHYKDFQFGLSTMREHWESGLDDIRGIARATATGSTCPITTRASSRTIFTATGAS